MVTINLKRTENPQITLAEQQGFAARASTFCPACGKENASEAVFCVVAGCHKALGEFKFANEELKAETRWHEALAEKVSSFIGNPSFFVVHAFWFAVWLGINTGILAFLQTFDAYPFGLLSIILAIEAIFITGFLLISQNRQSVHADKRAELDYEVNVRTYREIRKIKAMLQTLERELNDYRNGSH